MTYTPRFDSMRTAGPVSGAPDKRRETMIVEGDIARCHACKRLLGSVQGQNLHGGEMILVTTTPIRCRSCNERNVWVPIR